MKQTPKDTETKLPKKYVSGLSSAIAKARKSHWAKTSKMDPKNPAAYTPAPGDKSAKTKESKYTKAYKAKFGEEVEMEKENELDEAAGLAAKAAKSGISAGTLRKVYNRGMAAWRTGHRPGTTPQQWAMARVNSYITKGKTYHTADKDLRGESVEEACWTGYKQVGMKKKGSRTVPNCVKEISEPHSTDKNKSSSRFDGSNELVSIYKNDTPGQSRTLKTVRKVVRESLGDCGCGGNCKCGDTKKVDEDKSFQNPSGGLSRRGREHYNRTTGSNLRAPVTTEPSKLKKGSKSYNRRKSFCARMGGMKEKMTSAKTARDPGARINKALRKWNC
jgi:hypothetical protein